MTMQILFLKNMNSDVKHYRLSSSESMCKFLHVFELQIWDI